jgi:hypothetical protein
MNATLATRLITLVFIDVNIQFFKPLNHTTLLPSCSNFNPSRGHVKREIQLFSITFLDFWVFPGYLITRSFQTGYWNFASVGDLV